MNVYTFQQRKHAGIFPCTIPGSRLSLAAVCDREKSWKPRFQAPLSPPGIHLTASFSYLEISGFKIQTDTRDQPRNGVSMEIREDGKALNSCVTCAECQKIRGRDREEPRILSALTTSGYVGRKALWKTGLLLVGYT